jgi:hypothetical protein
MLILWTFFYHRRSPSENFDYHTLIFFFFFCSLFSCFQIYLINSWNWSGCLKVRASFCKYGTTLEYISNLAPFSATRLNRFAMSATAASVPALFTPCLHQYLQKICLRQLTDSNQFTVQITPANWNASVSSQVATRVVYFSELSTQ